MPTDSQGEAGRRADPAALLRAYDDQLRTTAEVARASRWDVDGPLLRAVYDDGYGFVTYRALTGYLDAADGAALDELIERTIRYFATETDVQGFEWKTRGHDFPRDLTDRLAAHGLEPEEVESVMVGPAAALVSEAATPEGIVVRRLADPADGPWDVGDVRDDMAQALRMQGQVFGNERGGSAMSWARRIVEDPEMTEYWIAETQDDEATVVCAGRLELVPGTQFAGIWGGATSAEYRGRGIYRAITSARARSAISKGVQFIHSDSSAMSRPILERAGLVKVTTTTPYQWRR